MIGMPRSVEKEKEINFQSCNYLHLEFKACTYGSPPPPHWFIVHKSLRVAAKWFCGGSRSDITIYRRTVKIALKPFNTAGLKKKKEKISLRARPHT